VAYKVKIKLPELRIQNQVICLSLKSHFICLFK